MVRRGAVDPATFVCNVAGCGNTKHKAHGWCDSCYQRWRNTGTTDYQEPGYQAIHRRLKMTLGPASNYQCVDCGKQAAHWSYQRDCQDEKRDATGTYCIHPEHYAPRCHPCHRDFDGIRHMAGERNSAAKVTEVQVREIRAHAIGKKLTYKQIGELYGIGASAVGAIVRRENWPDVD